MKMLSFFAITVPILFGSALGSIHVQILAPSPKALIYEPGITVSAKVTSDFDVKKVVAILAGKQYPMSLSNMLFCEPGPCQTGFAAAVPIKDAPKGWNSLSVQATDVFDATGEAAIDIYSGERLRLDIIEPYDGAVAVPDMRFKAACFADSQACRMTMKVNVAGMEISIDPDGTILDTVLKFRGLRRKGTFNISACDRFGNCIEGRREFWIEPDTVFAKLHEVEGIIRDFIQDTRPVMRWPREPLEFEIAVTAAISALITRNSPCPFTAIL
jgi:hypothetical protein